MSTEVSTAVWEKGMRLADDGRVRPMSGWQVGGDTGEHLVTRQPWTQAGHGHPPSSLAVKPQPCVRCFRCSCPATVLCSHIVAVLLLHARGEL